MQPLMMRLLQRLATALGSEVVLKDTHISNYLKNPTAQIDCSGLASPLVAWTQLIVPFEFKVGDGSMIEAAGQLIERCQHTFQQQPSQQHMFAVAITLASVEVISCSHGERHELMQVRRSGSQPLSLCSKSKGLQWICRILQADKATLGYCAPKLPPSFKLGHHNLSNAQLLAQGTARESNNRQASYVYSVEVWDEGEAAVLKLNSGPQEVCQPHSQS